jgi:saccharopine dehydrogenase-like NADP-dependent oxidoreductase
MQVAHELRLPAEQVVQLDARDPRLSDLLRGHGAQTLIHTAGPFQAQDYSVAHAAIHAGCHYVDLADARKFVAGISALDASARERGVSVVSGASSVPGLSSAVIDQYLPHFERLDSIRIGISSGARSPGLATMRGVFGYCGKPFDVWQDGVWTSRWGWLDRIRYEFPAPLGARYLGRCDVPDLELFPHRYPSVKTVSFHAGFASNLGHLVVWSLAGLVKAGVLSSLVPLAPPLHRISQWMEPVVSDKGGMFVIMDGIARDGAPEQLRWHLIASQNHGPHIPCGAAIALARKLASGAPLPRGAMPCMGLLTVEEYLAPLSALDIQQIAA